MKPIGYHLFYRTHLFQGWFVRRFTVSGRLIVLGLMVSAIVGLDTKGTLAYQVFALIFGLLLVAMVTGRFFRCSCTITRILPRFGTVGTDLTYRIIVHNPSDRTQDGLVLFEKFESPCPSLEEFTSNHEPAEQKRNRFDRAFGYYRWLWLIYRKKMTDFEAVALPTLRPRSKTEVTVKVKLLRRGTPRFEGYTIGRTDPLGLFYAWRKHIKRQAIPVLPERFDLPPIALAGNRQYQSGGVALASSVGDSEEFISMRDYRPGDPIRKIHWKSWAKTGRPVVKEYQDEYFVRHALILDTYAETVFSEKLEAAVSIAASLACEVRTQESLLDLMFVGTEAFCFTAGRGLAHTDRMLEILSAVKVCQKLSFNVLASLVTARASMLSGCVCIFLCWDNQRKKLVDHLRAMGIAVLVLVVTEESVENSDPATNPDRDRAAEVHWLKTGSLQQGLMRL